MVPFIKEYLLRNWNKLRLEKRPDDLLFIKFADRGIRAPQVGIITFLVKKIYRGKEESLCLLRFPRYPRSIEALQTIEREHKNLTLVTEKIQDSSLLSVVPKPILLEEVGRVKFLVIEFLPGGSLDRRILSNDLIRAYIENFLLAFGWLMKFESQWGGRKVLLDEEFISKWVVSEIKLYQGNFPQFFSKNEAYFLKIIEKSRGFKGRNLVLYPQHGDFHASNIFEKEGKISGIVDWEDFEIEGLPCQDLFHYIKTYVEALFIFAESKRNLSLIEWLSTNPDWVKAIEELAESYCRTMGIDPSLMEILLPLYLVRLVNIEASPRKQIKQMLAKDQILLQLKPFTIADLLLYMSIFPYGNLYKKSLDLGNKELVDLCARKIREIQEISSCGR